MPPDSYEIRVCTACGLRYPRVDATSQTNGIRCPACLGGTRVALRVDHGPVPVPARSQPSGGGSAELAVLLDNIRSAGNVGSILRSADGFGFAHAYLCGITPAADHDSVRKTSLGAEESVAWSHHKDAVRLVQSLKEDGWRIFALEEHERAVELTQLDNQTDHAVLIVGNEVTGVDPELLALCDAVLHIPMQGRKSSFNVATAFWIAAYELRK